jgi:hypothetical protein
MNGANRLCTNIQLKCIKLIIYAVINWRFEPFYGLHSTDNRKRTAYIHVVIGRIGVNRYKNYKSFLDISNLSEREEELAQLFNSYGSCPDLLVLLHSMMNSLSSHLSRRKSALGMNFST